MLLPKFIYLSEPLKGVIFLFVGERGHYRGNSSEIHN